MRQKALNPTGPHLTGVVIIPCFRNEIPDKDDNTGNFRVAQKRANKRMKWLTFVVSLFPIKDEIIC